MRLSVLAVAMAMSASVVSAIDLIEIKGRHFYNKATGDPFFVRFYICYSWFGSVCGQQTNVFGINRSRVLITSQVVLPPSRPDPTLCQTLTSAPVTFTFSKN